LGSVMQQVINLSIEQKLRLSVASSEKISTNFDITRREKLILQELKN